MHVCTPHKGDTFGIYTVVKELNERAADGHRLFKVRCNVCNREFKMVASSFARQNKIVNACRHGKYQSWVIKDKALRKKFVGMCNRCYNPNDKDYRWYGACGVVVCKEWLEDPRKFEQWAYNSGYNPNGTNSLDRDIDYGQHCSYSPKHCRWLTVNDNAKWRTISNVITVDDRVDTGLGWASELGLSRQYINKLVRRRGKKVAERYIRDLKDGFIPLIPKDPNFWSDTL